MQSEIHALAVDVMHPADPIRFEDVLHRDDGRVVDEGVTDHERLLGPLTGADDRFSVTHGMGQRLLDEDVLPRRERLLCELPVGTDRRDDADGVDRSVLNELAVISPYTHSREA